jgi:virginiamycin B lyase
VVRRSLFALAAALMGIALLWMAARPTAAQSASIALTGVVSSQHEGAMEGVIVSATRAASTITVSVVSDARGRYSFPRNRLEPGTYSVRIRAVGYELESPGTVNVTAQHGAQLDLRHQGLMAGRRR